MQFDWNYAEDIRNLSACIRRERMHGAAKMPCDLYTNFYELSQGSVIPPHEKLFHLPTNRPLRITI